MANSHDYSLPLVSSSDCSSLSKSPPHEPVREVVDVAHQAITSLGIAPIVKPIRGGTDGSQLSYMGMPTPNIFTGGENYHGRYEFISVDNMAKAVQVIVEIVQLSEQQAEG